MSPQIILFFSYLICLDNPPNFHLKRKDIFVFLHLGLQPNLTDHGVLKYRSVRG